MKKILFTVATGLICFSYSCKDAAPKEAAPNNAAKYKAGNAVVYKAIETGDVSKLDSVLAKDAIDHGDPQMTGKDILGRDSIKAMLAVAHTQFTNFKIEVLSSATDGDYSLERVRMTGTVAVPMGPTMPVGSPVDMTSVEVVKWKDGMAIEHWTYIDAKEVVKMMPPPPPAKEDKTKPKM